MTRKAYILLLLFAAWPVNNAFKMLTFLGRINNRPFLFNSEEVNMHWYSWHMGSISCYIMIFWAIWLYINGNYKRDRDVLTTFGALFITQCSDLLHYAGWQRHNQTVLFVQGFVILFAALILLDRHFFRIYGGKR